MKNSQSREPIFIDEKPTPNLQSQEGSHAHLQSLGLSSGGLHHVAQTEDDCMTLRTEDQPFIRNINPNSAITSNPISKRINKSQGRQSCDGVLIQDFNQQFPSIHPSTTKRQKVSPAQIFTNQSEPELIE